MSFFFFNSFIGREKNQTIKLIIVTYKEMNSGNQARGNSTYKIRKICIYYNKICSSLLFVKYQLNIVVRSLFYFFLSVY